MANSKQLPEQIETKIGETYLLVTVERCVDNDWVSLGNEMVGVMAEDGSIRMTSCQLSNIHEFLKPFCQPNTNEG